MSGWGPILALACLQLHPFTWARAVQHKEYQFGSDLEQEIAACSNQLKPGEEINFWDAGMSHGPCGQEVQLAWNQELGNQKLG